MDSRSEIVPVQPCIDFHFHSVYSIDAFGIPSEYVAHASACGVTAIAPTEHDNVDSLPKYRDAIAAQRTSLALYAGVEIDVFSPKWGHFHMLGYFFEPENKPLCGILAREVAGGRRMLDSIVKRMNEDGQDVDLDAAFALARKDVPDRAVGGKALWMWMHETGRHPSINSAKATYVKYAQQIPQKHRAGDFEEALNAVHDAGGICVLAHPAPYFQKDDVIQMLALGLDGVEIFTPSNRDHVSEWAALSNANGWVMTGGSDYHGATGEDFTAWPTGASTSLLEPLFMAHEKRHGCAPTPFHSGV